MNRKERRAAASRGDDTMGKSYTVLPGVPASVRNIEGAARWARRWLDEHPGAVLRWLEWDGDRTFIAIGLDKGAPYLADSPDAFRLLAWLDEMTGRRLSLNQAGWALRKLGLIPMPDGSTWKGEPS